MQAELAAQLAVAFGLQTPPRAFVLDPGPALRARLVATQSGENFFRGGGRGDGFSLVSSRGEESAARSGTRGECDRGNRDGERFGSAKRREIKRERERRRVRDDDGGMAGLSPTASSSPTPSRSSHSLDNMRGPWVTRVIAEEKEKERQNVKSKSKVQAKSIRAEAKPIDKGKVPARPGPVHPQWIHSDCPIYPSSGLQALCNHHSSRNSSETGSRTGSGTESEGRSDAGRRQNRNGSNNSSSKGKKKGQGRWWDAAIDLRDPRSGVMPPSGGADWLTAWRREKARVLSDMGGGLGVRIMRGGPARRL